MLLSGGIFCNLLFVNQKTSYHVSVQSNYSESG